MGATQLAQGVLTGCQMEQALAYVEKELAKNPYDVDAVDEQIDAYTLEVYFYTYGGITTLDTDDDGKPAVYLTDSDGDLLESDTDCLTDLIRAMLDAVNVENRARIEREN